MTRREKFIFAGLGATVLIFIFKLVFVTQGVRLDLSFPTGAGVGDTLFQAETAVPSEICLYGPYDDCGTWCEVSEKHVLLAIRKLDSNQVVRMFFDRVGTDSRTGSAKEIYSNPSSKCLTKETSEPFRLFVLRKKLQGQVGETVIGLQ